jgi:hypothetical protein
MFYKLKCFCFLNHKAISVATLLMLVTFNIVANPVMADGGFGKMGENVAGQFTGLTSAVKMFAWFFGFVLVVGAFVLFAGMKKPGNQTPAAVPVIMMICGFALLSIMTFIQMGSTSMFGSDESSAAMNGLGLGL